MFTCVVYKPNQLSDRLSLLPVCGGRKGYFSGQLAVSKQVRERESSATCTPVPLYTYVPMYLCTCMPVYLCTCVYAWGGSQVHRGAEEPPKRGGVGCAMLVIRKVHDTPT